MYLDIPYDILLWAAPAKNFSNVQKGRKNAKGLFKNDLTQIFTISDTPAPSVTLKWLRYEHLHIYRQKSVNPYVPKLGDVIYVG